MGWGRSELVLFTDFNSNQMKRAFLHEIFHNYYADHVDNLGHIMNLTIIFGGWYLHEETESAVTTDIEHFDGPP